MEIPPAKFCWRNGEWAAVEVHDCKAYFYGGYPGLMFALLQYFEIGRVHYSTLSHTLNDHTDPPRVDSLEQYSETECKLRRFVV